MAARDDPFESIFRKALSEISARYIPGVLRYGERSFPSVKKEIKEVEERLNRIWKSGSRDVGIPVRQAGGDSSREEALKEFRDLLKRWYHLHMRIIESYRARKRR